MYRLSEAHLSKDTSCLTYVKLRETGNVTERHGSRGLTVAVIQDIRFIPNYNIVILASIPGG